MQMLRTLSPPGLFRRCTPHFDGRFEHDYLEQKQQRQLYIQESALIKSMAAVVASPSEGTSAAQLMFNVELRGVNLRVGLQLQTPSVQSFRCNFLI